MAKPEIEFQQLWDEACRAAQAAAEEQIAEVGEDDWDLDGGMPLRRRSGDGSAYLEMPATLPFAIWWAEKASTEEGGDDACFGAIDDGKLQIWDSQFSGASENMSVHEAAALAARDVLARGLQTSAIAIRSQPD